MSDLSVIFCAVDRQICSIHHSSAKNMHVDITTVCIVRRISLCVNEHLRHRNIWEKNVCAETGTLECVPLRVASIWVIQLMYPEMVSGLLGRVYFTPAVWQFIGLSLNEGQRICWLIDCSGESYTGKEAHRPNQYHSSPNSDCFIQYHRWKQYITDISITGSLIDCRAIDCVPGAFNASTWNMWPYQWLDYLITHTLVAGRNLPTENLIQLCHGTELMGH